MRRPQSRWLGLALTVLALIAVVAYWAMTLPSSPPCGSNGSSCVLSCPCFSFGTLEETHTGSIYSYEFIGVSGALIDLNGLQFQVKNSQGMIVMPNMLLVNSTLSPVTALAEYNFSSNIWSGDVNLGVNSTMTFGVTSPISLSGGTIYAFVGNSEQVSVPIY